MSVTPLPWPDALAAVFGDEPRLWHIDLDAAVSPEALASLDADERQRAARFVFDLHRHRFLAAHAATRMLLAQAIGCEPASIGYVCGPHGKPRVVLPASLGLRPGVEGSFNLSHSEDVALLLWSPIDSRLGGEWGVDVERLRTLPDAEAVSRTVFTAAEHAEWRSMPQALQPRGFLQRWTCKEACLKAIGSGLSIAPRGFGLASIDEPCEARVTDGAGQLHRVWVAPLDVSAMTSAAATSDIVAAVARCPAAA